MRGRSLSRVWPGWPAPQQDRECGAVAAQAHGRQRDRRGQPVAEREQAARRASPTLRDRTQVREPIRLEGYAPSARLAAFVGAGTAPQGAKTKLTGEYWAAIAELLDLLVGNNLEIGTTAQILGLTTGALSKQLLHDDQVARVVNDLRRAKGMRALR